VTLRRGVGLVLGLIGLAVLVSFTLLALLYLGVSRRAPVPRAATLVLRPGGDLPELPPDDVVGQFFGQRSESISTLIESLRLAKRDARITSLLLRPSSLDLPYWAKVQELRDAVLDFKKSGKPVVAFLEFGGDREYYLATAADSIYLLPASPLDLTGVASYEIFLRGALDKLGVRPEFPAHRRLQDRAQPADRNQDDAGAPRDGDLAQSRGVRPAGGRDRGRARPLRG
jgi:protease-4